MKRALLLSLALVAACGGSQSQGISHACNGDSDCPGDQVCFPEGCADPDKDLVVQVTPQQIGAQTLATQDFPVTSIKGSLDLILGPPATIHFTSSMYPFTVSFNGHASNIPDLPIVLSPIDITGDTVVPVPPGNYAVQGTPDDGITPPSFYQVSLPSSGETFDLACSFVGASQLLALPGQIRGGHLLQNAGLSYAVQALHSSGTPATQVALAARGDGGFTEGPLPFTLFAPGNLDSTESLTLLANPHTGIGPSMSVSGTLTELAASIADGGLSVGNATQYQATGHLVDPGGAPIANASVQLVASLGPGSRFTSEPVLTDDAGAWSATCLHDPANSALESYSLIVVPTASSNLAIVEAPLTTNWDGGYAPNFGVLTVANLTTVNGVVNDEHGAPVSNANVQASPTPDDTLPLTPASTTTANDGTFTLSLSPGMYTFQFTPPVSLQAAIANRGPQMVAGGVTKLDTIQFSAANSFNGSVTDMNGMPVAGAMVKVFHVPPGTDGHALRSTLLAVSHVQVDGSFTVILPAREMP